MQYNINVIYKISYFKNNSALTNMNKKARDLNFILFPEATFSHICPL